MANRVKCLRVIDMYNCNVFVGLKHGGNLLQKVDNSSCSRTRWPEGELVFDLLSNRRPMKCRIDEGVDYESHRTHHLLTFLQPFLKTLLTSSLTKFSIQYPVLIKHFWYFLYIFK